MGIFENRAWGTGNGGFPYATFARARMSSNVRGRRRDMKTKKAGQVRLSRLPIRGAAAERHLCARECGASSEIIGEIRQENIAVFRSKDLLSGFAVEGCDTSARAIEDAVGYMGVISRLGRRHFRGLLETMFL